jgi:hypothetical protein
MRNEAGSGRPQSGLTPSRDSHASPAC